MTSLEERSVGLSPFFKYTRLHRETQKRILNDRDCKIIITARNSETGTGKTTLAMLLAEVWDWNDWDVHKGFMAADEYGDYYTNDAEKGDVLILDDAEASLDSRRGMSNENVRATQSWCLLRYKNVVSILTVPSVGYIDKRMREIANFILIVRKRGVAAPYRTRVDDTTGDVEIRRLRNFKYQNLIGGKKELIYFDSYESDKFRKMHKKKVNFVKEHLDSFK